MLRQDYSVGVRRFAERGPREGSDLLGKVKEEARHASLYAEVTTVLPFIVAYVLTKR